MELRGVSVCSLKLLAQAIFTAKATKNKQRPHLYHMWYSILSARVYEWSNISGFSLICVSVSVENFIAADHKSSNYQTKFSKYLLNG